MNTQTLIFCLVFTVMLIVASLIWLASFGYYIAWFGLGVILSIVLIGIGQAYSLLHAKSAHQQQQRMFVDNAQENLSIMSSLQKVQNEQNKTLMHQLGALSKLPQDNGESPSPFLIDDGIFDDLEQ